MEKKVFLRVLEPSDRDQLYGWHNNPHLYMTLGGTYHPVSRIAIEAWLSEKARFSEKEYNFAICLKDTSEHIGNIYLREIDMVNRRGVLGMFLADEKCRGRGYAKDALTQVIDFAFYALGLNRLFLELFEDNTPARCLTERCGFQLEGRLRNHVFKNGNFKDVLVMGLCKDEYVSK